MSEACQPTFEYFLEVRKPSCGTGTMMLVSSGRPSARSPVRQSTVTRRVMSVPEFVMKALLPLMTHSAPSSSARVRGLPASEPPPGSVSPKAARDRPEQSSGSHSRFCSSLPKRNTGIEPSPTAASSVIATDESARASSSIARHRARKSPPIPPYSSGKGSPNRPISPICRTMS